jgi:hypothetical protein
MLPTFIRCRSSSAASNIQTITVSSTALCAQKLSVAPRMSTVSPYAQLHVNNIIPEKSAREQN